MNIEVWGFSGKAGSGKNYVSEKLFLPLLTEKSTLFMAFADHFKIEAIVKDKLDYDKVFGQKDEKTRVVLQKRGTEEGRDVFGPDIWINILEQWMKLYASRGIERFIITDVRFPNEVEFIKKKGGKVIRIESPNRVRNRRYWEKIKDEHISEKALDDYKNFDYIIHNDYYDNPLLELRQIFI